MRLKLTRGGFRSPPVEGAGSRLLGGHETYPPVPSTEGSMKVFEIFTGPWFDFEPYLN